MKLEQVTGSTWARGQPVGLGAASRLGVWGSVRAMPLDFWLHQLGILGQASELSWASSLSDSSAQTSSSWSSAGQVLRTRPGCPQLLGRHPSTGLLTQEQTAPSPGQALCLQPSPPQNTARLGQCFSYCGWWPTSELWHEFSESWAALKKERKRNQN